MLAAHAGKPARDRLTLTRIFEALRGLGYEGGYDGVRRYAKTRKRQQAGVTAPAFVPLACVPVLARKPGALRNGAPFKDWVLPLALAPHRDAAAVEPAQRDLEPGLRGLDLGEGLVGVVDMRLGGLARRLDVARHHALVDRPVLGA